MCLLKEQDKTTEEVTDVEIGNLCKKEFRVMIVKIIKELGRTMDKQREKLEVFFFFKLEVFNEEVENTKDNQSEMKNTITEMKITLE